MKYASYVLGMYVRYRLVSISATNERPLPRVKIVT